MSQRDGFGGDRGLTIAALVAMGAAMLLVCALLVAALVLFGFFGITSTTVVSGTMPPAVTPVRAP